MKVISAFMLMAASCVAAVVLTYPVAASVVAAERGCRP